MNAFRRIWLKLRSLGKCQAVKREIDEELHLDQRTAENIAAGMSAVDVAREARRRFGNLQSVREECRKKRGTNFGEETSQDVRFTFRQLLKNLFLMDEDRSLGSCREFHFRHQSKKYQLNQKPQ